MVELSKIMRCSMECLRQKQCAFLNPSRTLFFIRGLKEHLGASGLFWEVLDVFGTFWKLQQASGSSWKLLKALEASRSFCKLLGAHGGFWELLGASESFWELLEALGGSGNSWEPLGATFEVIRNHLKTFGDIWSIRNDSKSFQDIPVAPKGESYRMRVRKNQGNMGGWDSVNTWGR